MRVKLRVNLKDGNGERILKTNMLVTTTWEATTGRKINDGKGFGEMDMAFMAHALYKLAGDNVPATWQEWIALHPDTEIISEDIGGDELNPTAAGLTADS